MNTTHFAILFPGQGSQQTGMLSALAETYPLITETFTEASNTLGYDLWQIAEENPEGKLDQTTYTQPILLTASVALFRLHQQLTNQHVPSWMAGHSLGEYSALVCAGSLSFADGLRLVSLRGQLMQFAVPEGVGAMAAIVGLTDEQVSALCDNACSPNHFVSPANFNSPGQVVIAGHTEAVEVACAKARDLGARIAKKLAVSIPSHCALMRSVADTFADTLTQTTFHLPKIPVIHNATANSAENVADIRSALAAQLYSPVRWTETITRIAAQGITRFIECGPGKVLCGLNKRIGDYENYRFDTPDTVLTITTAGEK